MANQFPVPPTSAETLAIATANGQTSFSFDWRANSADQVNVIYRPSNAPERVLVLGVDFSVQGLQNPAGGTVTLLSFSANADDRLYMYRFTTIDREKSWQNEGDYKADLVNKEQDEIYMIMQENRRDLSHNSTAITNEINDRKAAVEQERQERIAADDALASLIGNTGSGNVPIYDTKKALTLAQVHPLVNAIRLNGYDDLGDGRGGLYVDIDNGSPDTIVSAGGRTWWRVKDVGISRLGKTISKTISTPSRANAYLRSIKHVLPIEFPDYEAIVSQQGYDYIYPQSMAIDEVSREIFVIHESVPATDRLRWVSVFDWDSGEYKSCFAAGVGGGEGSVLRWEGNVRYLYVIYGNYTLGKFDVTTLPNNKDVITPQTTFPWEVGIQFSEYKGKWLAEIRAQPIGNNEIRRTEFGRFNDNFVKTGQVSFALEDTGFGGIGDSNIAGRIPKRQSIAIGNGYYAGLYGGIYRPGVTPLSYYNHQGIKLFNGDGTKTIDAVCHPATFMEILSDYVDGVTRIEAEGLYIVGDEIYSLFVTDGVGSATSKTAGLVIFKEFSTDDDAIDFSPSATVYPTYYREQSEGGVFPRTTGGEMYNPYTGEKFTTVDQILDFMIDTGTRKFSFYSSSVSVVDVDGTPIPSSVHVEIINANNFTFYYIWRTIGGTTRKLISGGKGQRSVIQIRDDVLANKIRMANTTSDNADKVGNVLTLNRDLTKPDVLGLSVGSFEGANLVTVGGLQGTYQGATNIRLATSEVLGGSGVIRWVVTSGGHLNPNSDDTYQLGVGSNRVREIYAANGTINTSDARLKTEVKPLTENEINAAKQLSKEIGVYKFLKSVEDKGDEARKHIGMTVQRAIEIMEDNGLNPMEYGFICYDEWDEVVATYDDEGNEIEPYRAAGSIYSFRHDELLMFIARGFDARLTAMEDLQTNHLKESNNG